MKVEITLTEGMLGTMSADPEIHRQYIASKSADKKKAEEELRALPSDELYDKALTVFPRDDKGLFVWDYWIMGYFKETLGILLDYLEPDCKIGKAKLSRWTYKKVVDNAVMIRPRKIHLDVNGDGVSLCTRPLRGDTQKGERVALATSEEVPAGTTFQFEVSTLEPKLDELIVKCLDRGQFKGFGQWRNSGKGRFVWQKLG